MCYGQPTWVNTPPTFSSVRTAGGKTAGAASTAALRMRVQESHAELRMLALRTHRGLGSGNTALNSEVLINEQL